MPTSDFGLDTLKRILSGHEPMETATMNCPQCKRDFDYQRSTAFECAPPPVCPKCAQAQLVEEQKEVMLERIRERVPDDYRHSDLSRFPEEWHQVCRWDAKAGKGLGLIGDTGKCKTRMVFERLVHIRADDGLNWLAITGYKLQSAAQEKWRDDEQREVLKRVRKAEILFIDDFGKQKFTEASSGELFDIIEERTSHRRPIVFTTNLVGKELESMLDENYAGPLLRRLREFCECITVK